MSVRDDAFASEIVDAKPLSRRDVVQEFIRVVGMDYFDVPSKVETALLNFWERGVRNGV